MFLRKFFLNNNINACINLKQCCYSSTSFLFAKLKNDINDDNVNKLDKNKTNKSINQNLKQKEKRLMKKNQQKPIDKYFNEEELEEKFVRGGGNGGKIYLFVLSK
jgi:hypothetical protein